MKKIILFVVGLAFLTIKNQAQTVTDYDGNVYNTVTIGTQIWMKENLKVTHFCNGDLIPNITNNLWDSLTTGARCYYNNDSAAYDSVYGALYNWFSVDDIRKLCPSGWHVPINGEWNIMEIYLDYTVDTTQTGAEGTDIGGKLKEIGTNHWLSPNTGATNSSGFSALPGGYRDNGFSFIGEWGTWWTATSWNEGNAWHRGITYNFSMITQHYNFKEDGFSIRCICDSLAAQIKENSIDMHMQIYPNPAIDRVYIDCASRQNIKMQVYNIIGACILQRVLTSGSNMIDISSLTTGIYIIRLTGADGTFQQKLIKD